MPDHKICKTIMKNKALKILNLILALFLAVFSISYVFAWFADGTKVTLNINGQARAYFAYGNGLTEDTAFGITDPIHLYNLAWLNNKGAFGTTKYYFKVGSAEGSPTVIDMSGIVMPPIGTVSRPFYGDFDGQGSVITNLDVTTDLEEITKPASYNDGDVAYSYAVGMFGETAAGSNVQNYILQDPEVEAPANGSYATENNTLYCAGIAVGYARGNVSNISVYSTAASNTKLKVEINNSLSNVTYTTLNSIIGGASEAVDASDITGVNPNVGDTGYFIPEVFYSAGSNVSNTENPTFYMSSQTSFKNNSWIIPNINSANSVLGAFSIITGSSVELEKAELSYEKVTIVDSQETVEGINQSYIDVIEEFYPSSTTKDNFITYCSEAGGVITDIKLGENSNNNSTKDEIANSITNGDEYLQRLNYLLYFNNSADMSEWENSNYVTVYHDALTDNSTNYQVALGTSGTTSYFDYAVKTTTTNTYTDEEGNEVTENVTTEHIYPNSIRVRITQPDSKIFVIAASRSASQTRYLGIEKAADLPKNSDGEYFSYEELLRDDYDVETRKGNYPTYTSSNGTISNVENLNRTSPMQRLELPSYEDTETIKDRNIGKIVACEFSMTNTGAGIYSIFSTRGGISIYYLAVVGVDDGENEGATTYTVKNVDFVYADSNGVILAVTETSYASQYKTNARVVFTFSTSGVSLVLTFNRTGTSYSSLTNVLEVTTNHEDCVTISALGSPQRYNPTVQINSISFPDWAPTDN